MKGDWVRDLWLNGHGGFSWMARRPAPADAPKCKTCGKPMTLYGYGLTDGKPPEPLYAPLCDCNLVIERCSVSFVDEAAQFSDADWDAMVEKMEKHNANRR